MEAKELLAAYKRLWKNRTVSNGSNEKETLLELVKQELKDEMTHPRLRKNHYEKFHQSIKRIILSSLHEKEKLMLINVYSLCLEQLVENDKEK